MFTVPQQSRNGFSRDWYYASVASKVTAVGDDYEVCYHGTYPTSVGDIVHSKRLCFPGETVFTAHGSTRKIQIQPDHIPNQGSVFVTPSFRYASVDHYAKSMAWKRPDSTLYVKAVLELIVNFPHTLKKQPETINWAMTADGVRGLPIDETEPNETSNSG